MDKQPIRISESKPDHQHKTLSTLQVASKFLNMDSPLKEESYQQEFDRSIETSNPFITPAFYPRKENSIISLTKSTSTVK